MSQSIFIVIAVVLLCVVPMSALASSATAQPVTDIRSRTITYTDDAGVEYQGYFAWDANIEGPRPGVLIIHAWWGLGDNEKRRARMLAELGYAAFALDMYGGGKHTTDAGQAGQWAGAAASDRANARRLAQLGLDTMAAQKEVDRSRMAGIGYCFGGTNILELAYSGAAVRGVVSFHGNPKPALEEDVNRVRASLLVCHGDADTLVPPETITAFTESLAGGAVDWQLITYAHAKHSFTTLGADAVNIPGVGYNAKADERSWRHMKDFLREVFSR